MTLCALTIQKSQQQQKSISGFTWPFSLECRMEPLAPWGEYNRGAGLQEYRPAHYGGHREVGNSGNRILYGWEFGYRNTHQGVANIDEWMSICIKQTNYLNIRISEHPDMIQTTWEVGNGGNRILYGWEWLMLTPVKISTHYWGGENLVKWYWTLEWWDIIQNISWLTKVMMDNNAWTNFILTSPVLHVWEPWLWDNNLWRWKKRKIVFWWQIHYNNIFCKIRTIKIIW